MAKHRPKHFKVRSGHRRTVLIAVVAAVALAGAAVGAWIGFGRGKSSVSVPSRLFVATTLPVSTTSPVPPPLLSASGSQLTTAPWVRAENARPGSHDWVLTRPATNHQIEGFANRVSVDEGGRVDLYVSSTAPTWTVQAFRMGYYQGDDGRLVWSSTAQPGVHQPPCQADPGAHMVHCQWTNPLPVSTAGWPQGDFLFKLSAATGWQSYIPLTIRDDASHSAFLVNNSVTTWQAYNVYGNYDLYEGPTPGGQSSSLADRARIVSFDRPYVLGQGAGDFASLELPMVATMEALGLDVSYTTDVDVSEQPALVKHHRAFISLGHDEYYSLAMRQGLQQARDAGVNLAFLGANAIYRHIRLQPSPLGPDREEIDYKDPYQDPLLGKDNADVTPWAWRDWPNNNPESSLLGEMWQCNPVKADMVLTDPTAWMFAGTGVTQGQHLPNVVGPEYDNFSSSAPNPGDVAVVARSPVVCDGQHHEADMTYYSAPSGAGVWDTGTIDWMGSIAAYCVTCRPSTAVTEITVNVLAAFGSGLAGRTYPSAANIAPSASPTTVAPGPTTTILEQGH